MTRPQQASERGLVAGNITIATPNGVRNGMGTPSGLLIEASFAQATSLLSSPAQFVLLIEKEAVFQRLLRDGFEKQWRCIMVTVAS